MKNFSGKILFLDRSDINTDEIIPAKARGLSAAIYTQLSDVEDETNGLLSYDRAVCKADAQAMRAVARELEKEEI